MYFNWFHFIGGSILLLQINSLVLLTANVEDIKRIAQKIVPESLADKLVDFVIKATNKEINVSQENSDNKDISANEWTKPKKYRPNQESYRKSKDKITGSNLNDQNSNEKPIPKTHRQNPYTFTIDRTPAIVSKDNRKTDKNFVRSRFIQNADSVQEVVLRTNTLTTEKERTEFDQYDNSNYPKSAGVIATSGRVALTKRPGTESDEN
ncbi:uncharacterized protein LOC110998858 [Pieris rapae]|uniref:uncharacterized protein LOC110998858 n=1 Tax=Pieris rapae TaxID=64459 RepID=UPI001E27E80D|nr:uncharacterized protein LOC110998858 [Pieris rapae]